MYGSSTQRRQWTFAGVDALDVARSEANTRARSHFDSVLAACSADADMVEATRSAMLDAAEERQLCQLVVETGVKFAKGFQPPMWPCVSWTALSHFRRFYTRRSNMEYSARNVIVACFYVAAKVDEFNVTIDEFVANLKTGSRQQNTEQILTMEPVVMAEIDYDLLVHNPLRPFEGHVIAMKTRCPHIGDVDRLRPDADRFFNKCHVSDVSLLYPPTQIALAALFYAARCAAPPLSLTPYLNELYANDQEKVTCVKRRIDAVIALVTSATGTDPERAAHLQRRALQWGEAKRRLELLAESSPAAARLKTSEWDEDSD